ncbi:hypothetical protein SUGI_0711050 [Cryptomeria japonica]|nr:hypothetical protein SUGI_0711050 [Cryptomeria japonica]
MASTEGDDVTPALAPLEEGDCENKPKQKARQPSKKTDSTRGRERSSNQEPAPKTAASEKSDSGNKRELRRPSKKRRKESDEDGALNQELPPGPAPLKEGDGKEKSLTLPVFNISEHSDDEDSDKEKIKGKELDVGLEPCPPGKVRVMAGRVEDLGAAVKWQYPSEQLEKVIEFCKYHSISARAHLVVLNVPSGTTVYGVDSISSMVPPWNILTPSFIPYGIRLASTFLSQTGWLVCIHTTEQDRQVEDEAYKASFHRWRSFILLSSHPIYYQIGYPNCIYTLLVSVFHREGEEAKPYYLNAEKVGHAECSLSRDTMLEKADPNEWVRMEDGRPWRGGAERTSSIWRFLVLAFTRWGDSVIDLVAGTGTLVKVASQLGRHALGIEDDHLILEKLLKPCELI